jgi:hypothetical protein
MPVLKTEARNWLAGAPWMTYIDMRIASREKTKCLVQSFACSATRKRNTANVRSIAATANRSTPFASAKTGSTIVRIAGKPAKFTWRKRVGTEIVRTELKTGEDARVRAGVRAALEHLGERHGLTKTEQREFANEVDRECCKVFATRAQQQRYCDVIVEEREDRLEVKISTVDETPAGGNNLHRHAGQKGHPQSKVLRVSDNGQISVTLVKHLHKNPAHS